MKTTPPKIRARRAGPSFVIFDTTHNGRMIDTADLDRAADRHFAQQAKRRSRSRSQCSPTPSGRASQPATNHRAKGSRRDSSQPSGGGGDSGDPDESDPANGRVSCKLCGKSKCKPGKEATCSACRQRRKRASDREAATRAARRAVPPKWPSEEEVAERKEWLGLARKNYRPTRPKLAPLDVDPEVLAAWIEDTAGRAYHGRHVLRRAVAA